MENTALKFVHTSLMWLLHVESTSKLINLKLKSIYSVFAGITRTRDGNKNSNTKGFCTLHT